MDTQREANPERTIATICFGRHMAYVVSNIASILRSSDRYLTRTPRKQTVLPAERYDPLGVGVHRGRPQLSPPPERPGWSSTNTGTIYFIKFEHHTSSRSTGHV